MFHDSPYSVEYAKSGRSKCQSCDKLIESGLVRLAILTQVPSMDERTKRWFHYDCFFKKAEPNGPEQIDAFEYLKFEDQRRILKSIAELKDSKQGIKRKMDLEDLDPNELEEVISVSSNKSTPVKSGSKESKSETNKQKIADLDPSELDEIISISSNEPMSSPLKLNALEDLNSVDLDDVISIESNESKGSKNSKSPIKSKSPTKPKNPTESKNPIELDQTVPDPQEIEDLLQHQSDLLFRNIEKTKQIKSFRKFPTDHWIQKIRAFSTDLFQTRYHIADLLTFGFLEACATCGGMLHYKLGRYCCVDCSFNVEYPERVFPDEELEDDEILDGFDFGHFHGKRECDPVLKKCFELRVKQVMDFLDSSDAHAQPESPIEPFINNIPDPSFEIPDCQILEPYNAVLVKVNILDNKNSYTRIQLLEDVEKKKFWVLRAYGRIGTTIRGRRVESFLANKNAAIEKFESIYEKQTENKWAERKVSTKQPDAYFHLVLDPENSKTNGTIYLPFGKPSKKQLKKAHSTLTEIAHAPSVTFDNLDQFAELWNQFYMYYPQSFGSERPALITDRKKIEQKEKIIDQLIQQK